MEGEANESKEEELHPMMRQVHRRLTEIALNMERTQIADYVQLLNSPRKLIWMNLVAGTSRGIGIALGFTFFTATIIYFLNWLGALNLPIIGNYIAEIVKVVQKELHYY